MFQRFSSFDMCPIDVSIFSFLLSILVDFFRTRRMDLSGAHKRFNSSHYLVPNSRDAKFLLPFLQDSYDLGGLHLGNVRLCLRTPNYGTKLPGRKTSDVFQYLTENFPTPSDENRVQFEHVLSEVSLLVSGLLEYQSLSKAVLSGKFCFVFCLFILFSDLTRFLTANCRISRDCRMMLQDILDLQNFQNRVATQVSFILVSCFVLHSFMPFLILIF